MEISPEVSLFECLHALGEVALGQACAEFSGDTFRAEQCVMAMIKSGWIQLVLRSESGDSVPPNHELRNILSDATLWNHADEQTAPVFLQITEAGEEAFEGETNFFNMLGK